MRGRPTLLPGVMLLLIVLFTAACSPPLPAAKPDDVALSALVKDAVEMVHKQMASDQRTAVFEVTSTVQEGRAHLTGRVHSMQIHQALFETVQQVPGLRSVVNETKVLPSGNIQPKIYGVANLPVVNLGLKPFADTGKSLATQAGLGETLRILDESNGWYLVRMWDDYLGWVNGSSIVRMASDELAQYRAGAQAEITAKTTILRDQPGGSLLTQAVQGVSLPLRSAEAKQGQVELMLPDGRSAWVAQGDIRVHENAVATFATKKGIEAVIATAKQYVGLPYLWGGTTALGFDCSGFTQFALRINGYQVLRDANMQYTQGDPVERVELERGDLVFFSTYAAGPSHMGIYLGDGEYIHSSGSLGVAISSFSPSAKNYSADLDQKYVGARRVIK